MTKKNLLKIIVPVFMVAVVAVIWVFQSQPEEIIESNVEFPLTVTSVDLEALSENNLPIIVDFGADECAPCKAMEPVLIKLNEELQGEAIIQFVDVWKNPDAARNFPVTLIPTQVLVNPDGTPYTPSDDLGIDFLMYADKETGEHIFTVHEGGLTEEQMLLIISDMQKG